MAERREARYIPACLDPHEAPMLRALRNLVERQILRAEASGQLSGLAGEGKPLPERPPEPDAGLAAALRMMAEAGVVPEEFTLQKALDAARAEYRGITDPEARRAAQREIAELEMRVNMAREARRKFLR